jgi:hypothetical protein
MKLTAVRSERFDFAQNRPFDLAQDRPFDLAQDRLRPAQTERWLNGKHARPYSFSPFALSLSKGCPPTHVSTRTSVRAGR